MDFFGDFPEMGRQDLRELKKGIDLAFREFSRANGDSIETFFEPLMFFMVGLEKLLIATPWPVMIMIFAALAWLGARSIWVVLGTVVSFLLIGWLGMWEDTMSTIALISVATILCIVIGMPLGIWMARSDRVEKILNPLLDIMQTIPIFVYFSSSYKNEYFFIIMFVLILYTHRENVKRLINKEESKTKIY